MSYDERKCCMKQCKSNRNFNFEEEEELATLVATNVRGCYTSEHKCFYSTGGDAQIEASQIDPSQIYSISQCLSNKITDLDSKLQDKISYDILNNDINIKNNLELEKSNYKKGLAIGALVAIVSLVIVYIFAKLKLIPLIYNQILDYMTNNQTEFIIILLVLFLIITFISYLLFIVKGGKGKQSIINGTMKLNNYLYRGKSKSGSMMQYDNFEMDDDNQVSYIFWLKINEDNKQYADNGYGNGNGYDNDYDNNDGWQHIFHIGSSANNTSIQYPGVWFDPSKNMLRITMSITAHDNMQKQQKQQKHIHIDNIAFEEWIHIGIVINNNSSHSANIEVYINSKLITTKLLGISFKSILNSYKKKNTPSLKNAMKIYVGGDLQNKTINGSISDLFNYNNVLTHRDIDSHYMSILVTTTGYLRYILKLLKSVVMYPKNLLFYEDETCTL